MVEQKVVAAEDARRHDHVGIDSPIGQLEPSRKHRAPALRLPAGILISDQQRRAHLLEKRFEGVVGMPANNETRRRARPRPRLHRAVLLHEVVMTQIGIGVVGDYGEEHDNRQAEQIGRPRSPRPAPDCPRCAWRAASSRRRNVRRDGEGRAGEQKREADRLTGRVGSDSSRRRFAHASFVIIRNATRTAPPSRGKAFRLCTKNLMILMETESPYR